MNLNSSSVSPFVLSDSGSQIKEVVVENTNIIFFSKKLNYVTELMNRQKQIIFSLLGKEINMFLDNMFTVEYDYSRDILQEILSLGNTLDNRSCLFSSVSSYSSNSQAFKKVLHLMSLIFIFSNSRSLNLITYLPNIVRAILMISVQSYHSEILTF